TISITLPDTQHLIETLLYSNGLFDINQTNECKKLATNLTATIDYIQLLASILMSSLKYSNLIFLTGQAGSGKSTLLRLVERTVNKILASQNVRIKEIFDLYVF
ncbi:unnamed protein product, partial [Didymodactylos carnosus]